MAEQKNTKKIEEKEKPQNVQKTEQQPVKVQEAKQETPIEKKVDASKTEENKSEKKTESKDKQVQKIKKEEAVANGSNMPISKKHSMYICSFIKNKTIDGAIADLESVIKYKRAIPFKGEIPHRKGPGMMSGRYPISASKEFIALLKGLKGNINVNNMDLEKTRIAIATASWANRPQRSGGRRFKRTNVTLIAKEIKSEERSKEIKK
ncbi:hypothetical protein J4408_02340 [Candidatus Pacearchaeota archaeon]|nr:hypothetical protein [Candidatus Pacearchaeota archaeon]